MIAELNEKGFKFGLVRAENESLASPEPHCVSFSILMEVYTHAAEEEDLISFQEAMVVTAYPCCFTSSSLS